MLLTPFFRTIALVSLLAVPALAQETSISFGGLKGDVTQPVEMTSNSLEINQADGTALFTGNVLVTQGAMKLSANQVRATYSEDSKTIDKIVASGKVLLVNATDAAEADNADYTIATGAVVMTGNVLLTQGQATIAAQKMTIDLKTGTGRMEGRVTTTFVPGKKK